MRTLNRIPSNLSSSRMAWAKRDASMATKKTKTKKKRKIINQADSNEKQNVSNGERKLLSFSTHIVEWSNIGYTHTQ